MNVKEDCVSVVSNMHAKTVMLLGAVYIRKKRCCQHNYI